MASERFTSTGKPGEPEKRSFHRLYQTPLQSVNDIDSLIGGYSKLKEKSEGLRRIVYKCLCTNEVLNQAIASNLPIEAVIPMSLVTGHEESIIFIGENFHESPRQGKGIITNTIIEQNPIDKIRSITKKGFSLSNQLLDSDLENLFNLWNRFGWTKEAIADFIKKIQSGEKNLWFSGTRSQTGQLVSATQAEAVEFAGLRYVETTEYSTLDGFEGNGLCTASVEGLIAQILNDTQYHLENNQIPTVITAEFNTSSTSSAVGANAGYIIPTYHESIPQILSYNVAVIDGQPANKVSFEKWPQNENEIPLHYLRDFAVAILPQKNINRYYSLQDVKSIINLYNKKL